jgi:hypothetical protein
MKNKTPPFTITNTIITYVAEIAELVGQLNASNPIAANLTLRRTNRIGQFTALWQSNRTR